jgi:cullin-4
MSKAFGKRPVIVDLTKPARSLWQSNQGTRKFVIKNLRTPSHTNDAELYYEKTKDELGDALAAIFERRNPRMALTALAKGVEDICRHGDRPARELFDFTRARCESYLNGPLKRSIVADSGSSSVDMLKSVYKHWVIWQDQLVCNLHVLRWGLKLLT